MASSQGYHEDRELLKAETLDRHRAFSSLQEELEAADWYDQRIDAAQDDELKAILSHNRDEEKEHAAMLLEWLRRRDPQLDKHLRTYLFTERPILEIEEDSED
jgi:ferritin-like protein